jgi:hypothetical protein
VIFVTLEFTLLFQWLFAEPAAGRFNYHGDRHLDNRCVRHPDVFPLTIQDFQVLYVFQLEPELQQIFFDWLTQGKLMCLNRQWALAAL